MHNFLPPVRRQSAPELSDVVMANGESATHGHGGACARAHVPIGTQKALTTCRYKLASGQAATFSIDRLIETLSEHRGADLQTVGVEVQGEDVKHADSSAPLASRWTLA